AEAGLLIHEGQLTYASEGLTKVIDLGEWWLLETGLPLPLGVNVARRDLGEDVLRELSGVLADSIRAGLENRREAMRYAMRYGRSLSGVRPDDLAALAVGAAVERAGVAPAEIEDVYLGCANQAGEDNRNVARMAALLAGLPDSVPGVTVNRLCASGLSAIVSACHAVAAGDGELFVAGGVESMSRAP